MDLRRRKQLGGNGIGLHRDFIKEVDLAEAR
jgi:hypothetical protein